MIPPRLRLYRLLAAAFLVTAALALWPGRPWAGINEPGPTPPLSAGAARTRLDGGQQFDDQAAAPPHELSLLNLGRQLDFMNSQRPDLLAELPGLGRASVDSARKRGRLYNNQLQKTRGLITLKAARPRPDHELN